MWQWFAETAMLLLSRNDAGKTAVMEWNYVMRHLSFYQFLNDNRVHFDQDYLRLSKAEPKYI
jgi:hypothetical protein